MSYNIYCATLNTILITEVDITYTYTCQGRSALIFVQVYVFIFACEYPTPPELIGSHPPSIEKQYPHLRT